MVNLEKDNTNIHRLFLKLRTDHMHDEHISVTLMIKWILTHISGALPALSSVNEDMEVEGSLSQPAAGDVDGHWAVHSAAVYIHSRIRVTFRRRKW